MSSKHSLNNSEIMSKPSSALSNQLLTKHALGQQNLETVLNHHLKRIKPSMQGFMNNLRRPKIVWQNFVWIKVKRRQLPIASRLRGSYLKRQRRSTNRIYVNLQLREQRGFTKHGQLAKKNLKLRSGSRMLNRHKQFLKTRTSQQIN